MGGYTRWGHYKTIECVNVEMVLLDVILIALVELIKLSGLCFLCNGYDEFLGFFFFFCGGYKNIVVLPLICMLSFMEH